MAALRLARAATRRELVLKFEGCYHGHADSFLVKAGSGVATLGLPDSPGVPAALAGLTLTLPFNDTRALGELFRRRGDTLAAVIVEPYVGNCGFIAPEPEFHTALRALCDRHGALLIFDEVMTGFRVSAGGAQDRLHVRPDLTTLGKIIGGGGAGGGDGGGAGPPRGGGPPGTGSPAGPPAGETRGQGGGPPPPRRGGGAGGFPAPAARARRRGAGRGAGSLAPSPSPAHAVGRNPPPSRPAPSRSCGSHSSPVRPVSRWGAMASCSSPTTQTGSRSGRSRRGRPGRS